MKQIKKTIKIDKMRSPCPIANALDIIGDKWTLLVIRDIFSGKKTYGEFQASPECIPTNILADRLKRLVGYGILQKTPYQQHPIRYTYQFTDKGFSLGPVVREVLQWGEKNIAGTAAKIKMNV